ncbi:prenyltransferase/squalene oxidase repeat-containing protein [Prosthecobacter vanneervenii]|uniref:Uncharacterized protein n=1 Tax=Prosthecobacter vanneervenii TaxID=48466 RepID=A0A7W7Y9W9_9BACT|nr:prenyltransferase/squalene oxidase repeat-containing protein [Prosthecobacter vanneervenii]MBB5032200.1 hypothetical protein [Prosthecobacter vanneervenii]
MKTMLFVFFLLAGVLSAQTKQDVQQAITRGLGFLKSRQDAQSGHWVMTEDPALSALVLSALIQNPAGAGASEELQKGYTFLLKNVQPDGGIYTKARANYNTAICLMALVLRARPEDEEVIRRASRYVAHQQNDADTLGKADNPFDGGIGYGGGQGGAHADLSNTSFALEALYYSKKLFQDTSKPIEKQDDLNWDAAIQFVSRCQNRKESNDQPWAGADKNNTGAFGYTPVRRLHVLAKKTEVPFQCVTMAASATQACSASFTPALRRKTRE